MKKIVLIGDSIRMGYCKYVQEALKEAAEVYYPEENCRFAQYVLRYAHDWKAKGDWPSDADLVHWNAGLWDVLNLFDDGPLTEPECYGRLIARIDKRLRLLFPKAKIVFATSTAVQEEKYLGHAKRFNRQIEEYNRIAIEALKDTDTEINDLYAVTRDCPEECHSDLTHYNTDAGRRLVGGQVLKVLCKDLSIDAAQIGEDFRPETISEDRLGY